jgi:hypothetical protein
MVILATIIDPAKKGRMGSSQSSRSVENSKLILGFCRMFSFFEKRIIFDHQNLIDSIEKNEL